MPHRQPFVVDKLLTTLAVGALRPVLDTLDDLPEPVADDRRQLGRRFLDVDLPVRVHAVGDVDPDPGQLGQFGLPAQTEPCAVEDQTFAAIEIEALGFQVPFGPRYVLPVRLAHLLVVRQREALDFHVAADQCQLFLRIGYRGRVLLGKRVEWPQQAPIEKDPERFRLLHEPVEHQSQVPFCLGNPLVDDFGTLGCIVRETTGQPIQLLPEDERSGFAQLVDLRNGRCIVGQLNCPFVPFRHIIEIPYCGAGLAGLSGDHRQPAALREAGAFQAKPEAPEIGFVARCQRISASRAHGGNELFLAHAIAVVDYGNMWLFGECLGDDLDSAGAGRDRIVDDV